MKFKQYIKPAIGIAAFVVGGLLARAKAEEGVDKLRDVLAMPEDRSSSI